MLQLNMVCQGTLYQLGSGTNKKKLDSLEKGTNIKWQK